MARRECYHLPTLAVLQCRPARRPENGTERTVQELDCLHPSAVATARTAAVNGDSHTHSCRCAAERQTHYVHIPLPQQYVQWRIS